MAVNRPIRGRRRPPPSSSTAPAGRNGGILPPRNNSNRSPRPRPRTSRPSFLPKLHMNNNNPLRRHQPRARGSSSRQMPSSQQQHHVQNSTNKEIELMEQYSVDYSMETSSTDCGKSTTSTASINCSSAARSALNNNYNDNNEDDDDVPCCSSFAIPQGHLLSPRGDTWLYLFLSSCTSTASLAVAIPPAYYRSGKDQVALAIMSCSTILSLGMAAAYRYTPSRNSLTRSLLGGIHYHEHEHEHHSLTLETLMALGIFTLWMIESALALGSYTTTTTNGSTNNDLAVTSSQIEIWNTNLYFATWVSASLISYIVADLLTIQDAHGTVPNVVYSCVLGNAIPRAWTLLFIATASLLAFSITLRSGDICTGSSSGSSGMRMMMMETTSGDMCTTGTLVGIVFGILGMVLAGGYLLLSLLERKVVVDDDDGHSHPRRRRRQTRELQSKKNLPSSILAVMALIGYSINAAFVTLPPLRQGMSSEPCNIYFSSWICFALSLYLCIRQAEAYLVPGSLRDVRTLIPPQDVKSLKATKNGLRRNSSRDSNTSTAPPSNFDSDPEYENELVEEQEHDEEEDMESHHFTQADKAMAAMADSVSEDGPMLFLPVDDHQFDGSDLPSLGSSWPSVTNVPPNGKTFQYNQQPSPPTLPAQQQQPGGGGREPHKPRSINPGGRRYNSAASVKSGSRPQAEPPAYNSSEHNCSRPSIDPAPLGASFIGQIDSKIQPNSSSSDDGNNGLRRSRGSTNTTKSSRPSTDPGGHSVPLTGGSTSGLFMGSLDSTSGKSYPVSVNPLDRNIRPPTRSFLGVGGTQQAQAEPSVRLSRDPSFRAPPPPPPPQPPRRKAPPQRKETLDTVALSGSNKRDAESTIGSAAQTIDQSTSAKSKSSKHSERSKSRSGSRKKRRSKSRDGSEKKSSRKSRSSSRNKKKSSSGRSNKSRKSNPSSGDRSSMHSSGTPAQGPPTVSASSHATPRTNDDQSRMGKLGPGDYLPTSATLSSGDHQRPVVAVQGSLETMSMMSEVSVDACFNASGEKGPPPPPPAGDHTALRFSNNNLSGTSGSSQTNENKTLRQGAVDKMVMEALRQAQEARQTSHHDLGRRSRTTSNQTIPAPQDLSNSVPNTPGLLVNGLSPPFTPGGQSKQPSVHQSSGQGATTSSRRSRGSKSPHQKKPDIKAQRRKSKRSKASGTSASPSLHSFYSESQATSFDADDAFAC